MKKYLVYELKRNLLPIGCLTLILSAVYVVTVISGFSPRSATGMLLWVISLLGGLLAAGVPVWIFGYRMKKRSVDLYYSLPLSHGKILTVRFILGLVAVFGPYTVAYWLGAFAAMSRYITEINAVWYIPQYFASLLPVYFIYSISCFVFTRANTMLDGILFVALWTGAAVLVTALLMEMSTVTVINGYTDYVGVVYNAKYFVYPNHFAPWAPLDFLTAHFQEHMAGYQYIHEYNITVWETVNIVLGFTVTAVLSAGASAGFFLLERNTRAENAGQISGSPFGYKVMLPLYIVCLIPVCKYMPIVYVFIAVGAFTVTAIYKRTPKIGLKQTLVLVCSAVAGFILCIFV